MMSWTMVTTSLVCWMLPRPSSTWVFLAPSSQPSLDLLFLLPFLSNPMVSIFLCICLFLEATGIAADAWVLSAAHKHVAGFQHDEAYIGNAEECEAKDLEDEKEEEHALAKLPGFTSMANALAKLMSQDPSVKGFFRSTSINSIDVDDAV
eukprot:8694611-Ditylum_brightwellii.AAC.1